MDTFIAVATVLVSMVVFGLLGAHFGLKYLDPKVKSGEMEWYAAAFTHMLITILSVVCGTLTMAFLITKAFDL